MSEMRQLVPHAGDMCLLERVAAHDEHHIVCATWTHRSATNPLRRDDRLAALHLVEYGAQAMAAHGVLRSQASSPIRSGRLVSVREVKLEVARLDDLVDELRVRATWRAGSESGQIYEFEATCGERVLGSGRVAVIFLV